MPWPLAGIVALLGTLPPPAAPVPAAQAVEKFRLPEGFRATLYAGEPHVVQPISICFDDRGRLWAVECHSYPKWRHDGQGKDRVVILEDTNGDGIHDKRTVFLETGSNLSGIEIGFGGVWLCSIPHLLFIPDRNGDDRPDGPAEVVLDGWDIKQTIHNVFNSLAWGPDGWLYGCNGIQAKVRVGAPGTPENRRTHFDCGIWRYHPTQKTFEVFCHGTTNPFGLDWDDHGNLFFTNCVIDHLWHARPGAHFPRMYGQDPNPNVYHTLRSACDHLHWAGTHWTASRGTAAGVSQTQSELGGGHAHAGCAIYTGENFPPEYRNAVFMANIHGNRVNRDQLTPTPRGPVGRHAPDFLLANDPWFRGVCLKVGPEGALYVTDWTDTGECHNYNVADTSNGRIYRITFGTPKPWQGDLRQQSNEELWQAQRSRNEWHVRRARRILQERAAAGYDIGRPPVAIHDPATQLRQLWAGHAAGLWTAPDYTAGLLHHDATLRGWSVRLGSEAAPHDAAFGSALASLAATETDRFVREEITAAIRRFPTEMALRIATARFQYLETDPDIIALQWLALEPHARLRPRQLLELTLTYAPAQVIESAARYYLTRPESDFAASLETVIGSLTAATSEASRRALLTAIRLAATGRTITTPPTNWNIAERLVLDRSPGLRSEVEALAVQFGDRSTITRLMERLRASDQPIDTRRTALKLLLGRKPPELIPMLRAMLSDSAMRADAIRALATDADPATATALLQGYSSYSLNEQADVIQTLTSRPNYALALLHAIEQGQIPRAAVGAFAARQMQALQNAEVSAKLESVWGTLRPASAQRAEQTHRWKAELTPTAIQAADLKLGQAVYARHCASCHKLFGEGGDVGPELTGSQRASLDYLLENILDPSSVVPGEYRMTTLNLADGRVLTGIIRRETPQAITLRTLNEELILPQSEIEDRKKSPLSLMPEGLLEPLSVAEVRALVKYLQKPTR